MVLVKVLVNSYTGIVTSSLTTPKMKPSIDSLEELAASKKIGVVLRSDVSTGVQILEATSGVYRILGDQARSHPDRIFVDSYKLAAKLETGHFAYFWVNHLPTKPRADECFRADNKRKISRLAPIQLSDLTSAFLILGIGIGLATLVFLLETIYSKWGFFYVTSSR